jgi:hypothetical protein
MSQRYLGILWTILVADISKTIDPKIMPAYPAIRIFIPKERLYQNNSKIFKGLF